MLNFFIGKIRRITKSEKKENQVSTSVSINDIDSFDLQEKTLFQKLFMNDIFSGFLSNKKNLNKLIELKSMQLAEVNRKLQEKEEELEKHKSSIAEKEALLDSQSRKLKLQEEELTEYINKIFEQQERERIVKWLVNSIRESLNLEEVMQSTVEQVGKLLKVDRCLIALYNVKNSNFILQNEYRRSEEIPSVLDNRAVIIIPDNWKKILVEDNQPIVVNNVDSMEDESQKQYFKRYNIRSYATTPVIHKNEILGVIIVHQVQYQRDWGTSHIEILKDIGSQIAIAIRQATLYTQVQETTRLKSEFLASMSHEFRTPLNAIIGFSEMLVTGGYGELVNKQVEYLNNISISGKHLLRLVNDVLDLSKVESGNMELYYEKFESAQAIEETVNILRNIADKKNIIIDMNLADIRLNADIVRFKQIMYNLLSNAIKFSEENGRVSITSSMQDDKFKVEVQDTGIGIASRDREKIFMQFRQLDSSYSRKQEGTGLGLTLTKKLIELHNGIIDFQSEQGEGARFWFIIPGAEIMETNHL